MENHTPDIVANQATQNFIEANNVVFQAVVMEQPEDGATRYFEKTVVKQRVHHHLRQLVFSNLSKAGDENIIFVNSRRHAAGQHVNT